MSVLQKTANGFTLAADAPLSGHLTFNSASLAWVGPLVSPTTVAAGQLQAAVTIAGTLDAPQLDGKVSSNNLRILLADLGLDLHQGVLESDFQNDRLMIWKLAFGPAPGPFRQMVLSGPVGFAQGKASVTGKFKAERGDFDIGRPDRPTLS